MTTLTEHFVVPATILNILNMLKTPSGMLMLIRMMLKPTVKTNNNIPMLFSKLVLERPTFLQWETEAHVS